MKKFFVLIMFAVAGIAFAGSSEYRFLTLGDIHFEARAYHGVPGVKYRTKYSPAYANMWKKQMPELFKSSAALLGKDVPFILQLGDFTQGYLALKEQRAKMLTDSFNAVKSYYPDYKLFFAKGNHDVKSQVPVIIKDKDGKDTVKMVRSKRGNLRPAIKDSWDNATYAKAFLPLMEKELGQKVESNFAFRHGEDLYIFCDGFVKSAVSVKFLKETLKKYPRNRYVFFITHLPLFPCTTHDIGWLLPGRVRIANLLFEHNTVVLTAHTHLPSLLKVSNGKGSITQMVVSSIGYNWNTGKPFANRWNDFESMLKESPDAAKSRPRAKAPIDHMKTLKIESFEAYSNATGFVIVKVNDKGVQAEIYNGPSGKPAAVKVLK